MNSKLFANLCVLILFSQLISDGVRFDSHQNGKIKKLTKYATYKNKICFRHTVEQDNDISAKYIHQNYIQEVSVQTCKFMRFTLLF